jgi:serine kinase of HPr protein (carbohydrate metabolism regulator)
MTSLHGTCLEIAGLGIFLRGASGAGKSDLALRLLEGSTDLPAKLVADDRVLLTRDKNCLMATAPPVLRGLLEVRGIGLVRVPACTRVPLGLVVDLVQEGEIERAPEFPKAQVIIKTVALPVLVLNPFEASAAAKIRMAVRQILILGDPPEI